MITKTTQLSLPLTNNLTPSTTNLQSMEKSSYNNRKYATAASADHFNNHAILQNNSTMRKRASKKDRHSKINTAQGPRDRRMRLSLDVAKKFFKLQDMLGFDKASNTIDWLLTKSKPAIQDLLSQQLNRTCSLLGLSDTASSSSECEVMSAGIDSQPIVYNAKSTSSYKGKKRLDRGVRKSTYIHQSNLKETREQARERARKRTTEKRYNKLDHGRDAGVSGSDQVMDQNVNRLGSWIPFGENQVQTVQYPSSQFYLKQGIVDDNSSAMPNSWSQSFLFNYHQNPGPSHEHQFNDFSILGKPWEGTDN